MQKLDQKNYFWNTLGVLLQNAVSPALLLIVTRVNGIEASGLFSFAFAISLMMWAVSMWGGRTYQVSDTKSEFDSRSYILARIYLGIAVLGITGVFCAANQYEVYKTTLIFGLVVFKVVESIADVLYGVLQVHHKLHLSGKSLTIKALLSILVFLVIDITTGSIIWAVVLVVTLNIMVLLGYDYSRANALELIRFPADKIKVYSVEALTILRRCAPVFVMFFLAMFSLNVPRYFIDVFSQREIGYFGIIAMPITLVVLLISFVLQPNVLRLSQLYAKNNIVIFSHSVNKILRASAGAGAVMLLAATLVGVDVLKIVFGVDFSAYRGALIVIVAGGVVSAIVSVYLNIFVIMRRVRIPLLVLLFTNALLVIVALWAVRRGGLEAGVWAFTATNTIQATILWLYFSALTRTVEP